MMQVVEGGQRVRDDLPLVRLDAAPNRVDHVQVFKAGALERLVKPQVPQYLSPNGPLGIAEHGRTNLWIAGPIGLAVGFSGDG